MKHLINLTLVLLFNTLFLTVVAQKTFVPDKVYINAENQEVHVYSPLQFGISKPLKDIAIAESHVKKEKKKKKSNPHRFRKTTVTNPDALPSGSDPLWQQSQGTSQATAPIVNFEGLNDPQYNPLDPSGAASSMYYVQAINTSYCVYDKTGNILVNAANLTSLWPGSSDDGDPIVMYDKHADRWFISQFQSNPPFKLLVAVSQTNDPTGSFYTYSFGMNDLPDYPKYSVWWDGYYFSINMFGASGGVLERNKMLVGDSTAQMQLIIAPNQTSNGFTSALPLDADGTLPPNGSPCYFFNLEDDAFSFGNDGIRSYKMTTDWNNPNNTSIVDDGLIATAPFDTRFNSTVTNQYGNISQKGTTWKLDAVAGVFYYRAQHRVWSTHNSVVLSHVVDVDGNDRAGMRWYELRQSGTNPWTLYQEGTYAPTSDSDNRWMGSIAMDNQGNIGMAYSVAGPNTYPSIRYTGRLATDQLGQMTIAEQNAFDGEGLQDSIGGDRYGDYSHLAMDPNGTTFWHTTMYIDSFGLQKTRIYSFSLASATAVQNPYYQNLETKIYNTNNNILVDVQGLKDNSALTLDVFDLTGKLLIHKDVIPDNKQFETSLNRSLLPDGVYLVRFGNSNFQIVEKVLINR